jgi:hypothetical protein
MDYTDFHVRRIADDLRRAGIDIPGTVPTPVVTDEPQQDTEFSVAKGHKSTVYLPHWVREHRDDPALTVSSFVLAMCPN